MPTPYERIWDNLLPKFRSYEIPMMNADQVKEYLHDYLIPAITRFHVCRKDLKDRNDLLERFNCELSDVEIEILSNFCLIAYVDSTYVLTPTLLKRELSSKDFNVFSSANHLAQLMKMRNDYFSENETLLSRYAWFGAKESGILKHVGYKKNE